MGQFICLLFTSLQPRAFRLQKKTPIVLFEVLIALSLTAMLITFLFSFCVESAKIENKLDIARKEISERSMVQTRLQTILSNTDWGSSVSSSIYTHRFKKETQESLIVIFDNGIDPSPRYSGSIMGRLFLDANKNLIFVSWPLDGSKTPPWRTEILLTGVDNFQFEFLGKKPSIGQTKKEVIKNVNKEYVWRSLWPKSQLEIPSMIHLTIQKKNSNTPLHFAFHLPTPAPLVTYEEKSL